MAYMWSTGSPLRAPASGRPLSFGSWASGCIDTAAASAVSLCSDVSPRSSTQGCIAGSGEVPGSASHRVEPELHQARMNGSAPRQSFACNCAMDDVGSRTG
jgi:hypothetical protein